jgi:hypothetical protein
VTCIKWQRFCGWDLKWHSSSQDVAAQVERFISFEPGPASPPGQGHLTVEITDMPGERIRASEFLKTPGEPLGQGLLSLSPGPVPWQDYKDGSGVHYRIFPGLAAQIWDHPAGRYRVAVRTETLERHLGFSQYLLVFGLIALLRYRDVFGLHAGCVQVDGKGILLSAESGGGKSSTVLSLARAGVPVIGDERIFTRLAEEGGGYLAASPSPVIKVSQDSLHDLHKGYKPPISLGVYAKDLFLRLDRCGFRLVDETGLHAVCALSFSKHGAAGWNTASPSQMLPSLFPVTLPLMNQKATRATFNHLMPLLGSLACFQVELGRDAAELKEVFAQIARRI